MKMVAPCSASLQVSGEIISIKYFDVRLQIGTVLVVEIHKRLRGV